jgi:hypothetical protein
MLSNKYVVFGLGVVVGIVFAQQLKKVPGVSKLPQV